MLVLRVFSFFQWVHFLEIKVLFTHMGDEYHYNSIDHASLSVQLPSFLYDGNFFFLK